MKDYNFLQKLNFLLIISVLSKISSLLPVILKLIKLKDNIIQFE